MIKVSVVIVALLSVLFPRVAAKAAEVTWEYRSPLGVIDSSPAVADLDASGQLDIVVTTTAGSTIALDAGGRQMWMHGVQIPISISPTVADVLGGPEPEVLVLNQSGRVYCLAGQTGIVLWQYDLPAGIEWGTTAIAVADLDGGGTPEIITGDEGGHVVCLSPEGELLWQYDGDHGQTFSPAVGPLGGEGLSVVIAGSARPMVCLDAHGQMRWRLEESVRGAAPVIADINGDGVNEVLGAVGHALVAVSAVGEVLWRYTMPKEIDSAITVGDIDEDGVLEIYAVDLAGTVVSLTPEGALRWTASVRERVRRAPVVADLDGDGRMALYVAGYSGELHVFTAEGALKDALPMSGTTNAAPSVAALTGEGVPSLLYANGGGSLVCLTWPGAAGAAPMAPAQYRFNAARTGLYEAGGAETGVAIADIDFGRLHGGSNTVTVQLSNPREIPVVVTLRATVGGDAKARSLESAASEVTFDMGYVIPLMEPVSLTLECVVHAGEKVVAQRKHTAHVVPFRKEIDDLQRSLSALNEAAGALPEPYDLTGRTAAVAARLNDYAARAALAGTASDLARRELRDAIGGDLADMERLAAWAAGAAAYHEDGGWPLQLVPANPWAPFGGFDALHEGRVGGDTLVVEAFHGEVESAAFNVLNYGAAALQARVTVEPLTRGEGETAVLAHEVVALHEVVAVPTQTLDFSADALPRMNQGQILTLPGRDGRQCWLEVDTAALTPGTWHGTVQVKTLEVVSKTYRIPLTVEVWDVPLADTQVLQHCNWGYVARSFLKDYEDEALEDRIRHGNNVFVTSFVPRATYDEAGNLVGEIDYTAHDAFVERYAPHGMILFHNTGGIRGPGGQESDAYRKAFVAWMRAWVAHLKEMGIGYDRYAMYPVDEPGLTEGLVELYLFYAKLAREADPEILMYTDPVARITEEELREMLPYVDIWCPNRNGFLLDSGAEKMAIMKNSGVTLWNYECEGNAKHQSPLGYYRAQAWLAWHHGLTGIGFWSYCTSSADPWYFPDGTNDYLLVYPGTGPVASKRWKAIRDGVEDYAMLVRLRDALAMAKSENRAPDAVAEAEHLLREGAARVAAFCGLDADGTTPGKEGIPGVRRVADARWAAIAEVRRDVARLIPLLDGER